MLRRREAPSRSIWRRQNFFFDCLLPLLGFQGLDHMRQHGVGQHVVTLFSEVKWVNELRIRAVIEKAADIDGAGQGLEDRIRFQHRIDGLKQLPP